MNATAAPGRPVRLGLRENRLQFTLLVIVIVIICVGGRGGLELAQHPEPLPAGEEHGSDRHARPHRLLAARWITDRARDRPREGPTTRTRGRATARVLLREGPFALAAVAHSGPCESSASSSGKGMPPAREPWSPVVKSSCAARRAAA